MFQKVLVVEDLDSIGYGIAQMLTKETMSCEVHQALYCDDAYLKFLRAQQDESPFDLLITDLSFKTDHRGGKIDAGDKLIRALKEKAPHLKTIVYSVEDRPSKVRALFEQLGINGYVVKSRRGLKHLVEAIQTLGNDETYIAPEMMGLMNGKEAFEIQDYDVALLGALSNGQSQKEISVYFKENDIHPCSVSAIEKRLNLLKLELNAKNVVQLVAMVKDMGWL